MTDTNYMSIEALKAEVKPLLIFVLDMTPEQADEELKGADRKSLLHSLDQLTADAEPEPPRNMEKLEKILSEQAEEEFIICENEETYDKLYCHECGEMLNVHREHKFTYEDGEQMITICKHCGVKYRIAISRPVEILMFEKRGIFDPTQHNAKEETRAINS